MDEKEIDRLVRSKMMKLANRGNTRLYLAFYSLIFVACLGVAFCIGYLAGGL